MQKLNIDLQKPVKLNKRFFSLNPFWSSPKILEMTPESIILIALNNACNSITFYELDYLFGTEAIEFVYKKNKHKFGKRIQKIIETNLYLLSGEWDKDINIIFNKEYKINLDNIEEKCILFFEKANIKNYYEIAFILDKKIVTPQILLENIKKYYITYIYEDIVTILKYKQQEKEDEKLDGLIQENIPDFDELKNFILKEVLSFIDKKNKEEIKNKKVKVNSFKKKL